MILLEGFLVRLMIGITKNPSRRIINVTWMSKRMGLQTPQYLSVQSKLAKISEGFKREICGFVEKKCKHSLYIRRFFVVRCICKLSIGGPPKKCRKTSFPSYFLLVMMPKAPQDDHTTCIRYCQRLEVLFACHSELVKRFLSNVDFFFNFLYCWAIFQYFYQLKVISLKIEMGSH